jgi:hypothetical protein
MQTARATSGQPVKRGTMAHDHEVSMLLADAAAQLRDPAALEDYVPWLAELADRDNHTLYLAIAHRAGGVARQLAGAPDEAEAQLNQALALFGDLNAGWQLGRTHIEMAEVHLARGNEASARAHYRLALAAFEALRALPDVARTQAALEALS